MPRKTANGSRRIPGLALALALLLCACPLPALGQSVPPGNSGDAAFQEGMEKIFAKYDTMGASVAVIQNGEIVFTYAYGLRVKAEDDGPGEPVTTDTLFQVASISKMVTGIGLMTLTEDGRASLESPLSDLLGFPVVHPAYPQETITLRQLMSHTAALRDSGDYNRALQGNPPSLAEMLGGSRARLSFLGGTRPGIRSEYSNFGGGIAGSIVEAVSGQTLDAYMQERVFEPLGIRAAYQASLLPEGTRLADIYTMPGGRLSKSLREDATHVTAPDPDQNYYLSAGKLLISAPDLAKLLAVLCDGGFYQDTSILTAATAQEIRTPQNARGSVKGKSGRGLFMNIVQDDLVEGRTMYGHGGKAYGLLCAAYFDPLTRTGVVMLTNGCNNRRSYNGVGLLSREITSLCYNTLLAGDQLVESLWLVKE